MPTIDPKSLFSLKDKRRGLKIPLNEPEKLAEFLGILAGDGYIGFDEKKRQYTIEIVGDALKDKEYLTKYVTWLSERLFNLRPNVYVRKNQNLLVLRINSKGLYLFIRDCGFPTGNKGNFGIPEHIDEKDFISFIKGLADTDFSLALKRRGRNLYPVISIKLKSRILIDQIATILRSEGFSVYAGRGYTKIDHRGYNDSTTYSVELSGKGNLLLWMDKIGFRNKRHLEKYKKWESHNRVADGTTGI